MTTLSQFINYISKNGIARPNKFDIEFSLPNILINNSPDILNLTALNVTFPGYNISYKEGIYNNLKRRFPTNRTYSEFAVTFLCSGRMNEKELFDQWHDSIFNSNYTINFYEDYVANIQIYQLDNKDVVNYETTLLECYPITVGIIQMDRTSTNTYGTIIVTFSYRQPKDIESKTNNRLSLPFSNNSNTPSLSDNKNNNFVFGNDTDILVNLDFQDYDISVNAVQVFNDMKTRIADGMDKEQSKQLFNSYLVTLNNSDLNTTDKNKIKFYINNAILQLG